MDIYSTIPEPLLLPPLDPRQSWEKNSANGIVHIVEHSFLYKSYYKLYPEKIILSDSLINYLIHQDATKEMAINFGLVRCKESLLIDNRFIRNEVDKSILISISEGMLEFPGIINLNIDVSRGSSYDLLTHYIFVNQEARLPAIARQVTVPIKENNNES